MAVTQSMSMRTMQAKKNAALGAIAVSIARSKNDPLYHKLKKYRTLWKDTKNQLVSKYGSLAMQTWAKKQAGS
jgi:hypothetical protein